MSPELLLIIYAITYWTAVSIAYWTGWWARDKQRPPGGSYGAPRRRGSNPPPPGKKPRLPPARILDPDGVTIGYRSINYPDPLPDRRPTNPFNGERIPNPPPREP